MTAPAFASWAAWLGWLPLGGTPLAFMGYAYTPWILTLLALGELINDKRASTPSRTVPVQFVTRLITGAWSGAALVGTHGNLYFGAIVGACGAVIGTLGGFAVVDHLLPAWAAAISPLPCSKMP